VVNLHIPVFRGFLYNAPAKTPDFHAEILCQRSEDLRNNIARYSNFLATGRTSVSRSSNRCESEPISHSTSRHSGMPGD
jgi:hypothetical protein